MRPPCQTGRTLIGPSILRALHMCVSASYYAQASLCCPSIFPCSRSKQFLQRILDGTLQLLCDLLHRAQRPLQNHTTPGSTAMMSYVQQKLAFNHPRSPREKDPSEVGRGCKYTARQEMITEHLCFGEDSRIIFTAVTLIL